MDTFITALQQCEASLKESFEKQSSNFKFNQRDILPKDLASKVWENRVGQETSYYVRFITYGKDTIKAFTPSDELFYISSYEDDEESEHEAPPVPEAILIESQSQYEIKKEPEKKKVTFMRDKSPEEQKAPPLLPQKVKISEQEQSDGEDDQEEDEHEDHQDKSEEEQQDKSEEDQEDNDQEEDQEECNVKPPKSFAKTSLKLPQTSRKPYNENGYGSSNWKSNRYYGNKRSYGSKDYKNFYRGKKQYYGQSNGYNKSGYGGNTYNKGGYNNATYNKRG